jgi:hypothetical protein
MATMPDRPAWAQGREQHLVLLSCLNTLSEKIRDAVSAYQLTGEQSDEKA